MKDTICIYHGNCADGFTAAWAVYKALGPDLEYFPGVYGKPPPDVKGKHVIMVDFSYKRPVLNVMSNDCKSMVILDHHKTARDDLNGFPLPGTTYDQNDMLRYQDDIGNVVAVHALFDMERSGAGITWDYFHPGKARPLLVDYVEDRDLWQHYLPSSRNLNAFISSHEYNFENWDTLRSSFEDDIWRSTYGKLMGGAIIQKQDKDVRELVKVCKRKMRIGGVEVWGASLPYTLTSDAGHLMAEGEAFAACYWDTPEGRVFSLRSTGEGGVDVSLVAKDYGGGGHRNAAGFTVPLSRIGEFEV